MLQEIAGNEVSQAERSSAGHYPWRWAAPGAEEQTLGNILQHAPWSYRALWWVAVITDGVGVWGMDGPKPECFLPKAASERGFCNGWTLVRPANCNSEKECSSSWLSFTIIDTGSTKVTGDFMETVSVLRSGSRSTCFLRGRLEVNRWWVGVSSRAGAGTPCVKVHGNLLFYTMWKNNEGHAEGSGKAISTVSDLWPIQCSVCAVIGGIIYQTEALRSLLS